MVSVGGLSLPTHETCNIKSIVSFPQLLGKFIESEQKRYVSWRHFGKPNSFSLFVSYIFSDLFTDNTVSYLCCIFNCLSYSLASFQLVFDQEVMMSFSLQECTIRNFFMNSNFSSIILLLELDMENLLTKSDQVVIFYCLRLLLGPVIESVVLVDRLLFLLERGKFSVYTSIFLLSDFSYCFIGTMFLKLSVSISSTYRPKEHLYMYYSIVYSSAWPE